MRQAAQCRALVRGSTNGRYLDHPSFDVLLARAATPGVPIYVHPCIPPATAREELYASWALGGVTPDRKLEVRDIPAPDAPPTGHVIVKMDASAINHGDKTFLARPDAVGGLPAGRQFAVWGASGTGAVIAAGPGVTADCVGKTLAIYRSLSQSQDTVGLWCEWAQVPITTCLILPQKLSARDYCGSLVNVSTAYAFLDEVVEQNHKGII